MALRRMFANEVVDSDKFISLPSSSQNLYFHLGMKADDEGFIANIRIVLITSQAKERDLTNLIENGLIINLGDVYVISHWHINNTQRADRIKETQHQSKKELVNINKDGVYELKCQPSDNQMTTDRQPSDNQVTTKNDDVNQVSTKCQPNDNQMRPILKDIILKDIKVNNIKLKEELPGALKNSEPKSNEKEIFITLILNDKTEYPIPRKLVEKYKELYPAVDVEQEVRNMQGWLISNPTKRKTKSGILRFVNSWLSREQDKGFRPPINDGLENEEVTEIEDTGLTEQDYEDLLEEFGGN